jgi:zinc protease
MSFQEFRDALDNLRASLSFTGSPGGLQFSIQTKRENLPEVLKLLEQALKAPAFSESELEIVRRENIAQMEQMKSDPQGLAVTEFQRVFSPYEKDDPRYAPTIDESIERMNSVKVEQIRELHKRFVSGQHGQIAVVGDFDPETTRVQLDQLFAGWTSKEPYARIPEPAITGLAGKRTKINTPDKANAVYIAGMMLPLRDDHPDYEALAVANYVLGGGPLASRLADRVRKKEGLSYGVGSMVQADSQDERSMLMMFAISNPENTEKVVGTIDEEVGRFVESGVQAEELNNAISSYLETRKGARANDGQLAGLLLKNLETGRSMQFQAESDQKIRLLTKDRVDAVIKNLLDKERLIIITAGDFEKANSSAGDGEKK